MISLYSGTPGSGKSVHAAKEIAIRLRRENAVVLGNFYFNTKAVKKGKGTYLYVPNHRLDPDRLLKHRHYGFDIILMAQFDRMLDRQIRGLIEYEHVHRKVANAGLMGAFVGFLFRGNLFVCIEKWYPIKETIETSFFFTSKYIYGLYDSYNHFELVDEKPFR